MYDIKEDACIIADYYLDEFADPVSIIVLKSALVSLLNFLFSRAIMATLSKESKDLTKQLNSITRGNNKVYIINMEEAQGFSVGEFIVVTSGAIKLLNKRELMSVILHEYGHKKNFDSYKDIIANVPLLSSILIILTRGFSVMSDADPVLKNVSVLLFSITMCLIPIALKHTMINRKMEYRADNIVASFGYGQDLVNAIKKLDSNVPKNNPGIFYKILRKINSIITTHPIYEDRIKNLLLQKELYKGKPNKEKIKSIVKNIFEETK